MYKTHNLSPLEVRKLTQLMSIYKDGGESKFIDTLVTLAPNGFDEPALDRIHDWWWEVYGREDEMSLYMDL